MKLTFCDKVKEIMHEFDVFSTVHHSIGLFLQPTLMHNSITTAQTQNLVSSLF